VAVVRGTVVIGGWVTSCRQVASRTVFLDGPARLFGSPFAVARDRLGEPGGVVGFAAAHEGEGEAVGAVSGRDRGHHWLHPGADTGSVAGEVGVALGQCAPELDDRGA